MKVKFLGAAGTVTGSGYILTSQSGQQILIDLGLFQGGPDEEELNYRPIDADFSRLIGAVLTHAHLDHCGRIPLLIQQGFTSDLWMTPPTRDIMEISLLDSAKIFIEDHPEKHLYSKHDVDLLLARCKTINYSESWKIGDFKLIMRDAGHILGSASIEIEDLSSTTGAKKITFSGDLGNTPEDLLMPTTLISDSEIVIMESTYGDSVHPVEDVHEFLTTEINAIESNGGVLLIPAFSLERSQELLHIIDHLKRSKKVKDETTVYLDSPMAQKVTTVYSRYPQMLNPEVQKDFADGNPFDFPGLKVTKDRLESMNIFKDSGPKVIIAGSGMMTGGRIVGHALQYLPMSSTRLLIVGYQGEGTLGRELVEDKKEVTIDGVKIYVKANINKMHGLSSHADQPRLMKWLSNIKGVKSVVLTHGENPQREALSQKIQSDLGITNIHRPMLNQELEF